MFISQFMRVSLRLRGHRFGLWKSGPLQVLALVGAMGLHWGASAAAINIDFKGIRNVPGPDVQGPTYVGQGAGGGGTFWTGVVADSRNPAGGVDLDNLTISASNLKDSNGNATPVKFTVSPMGGDVGGPSTTVATSSAALFSDYVFNNSAGNNAGESPFTIEGLPGTTADLYIYRTSGGVTIPGKTPITFTASGIFNSGNTTQFKGVPVSGGKITGTFGSGTAVIVGFTIVTAGDFNPQPVSFVKEPVSQTVNEGDLVTFTAEVKNLDPVNYQWERDGVPVANATNSSYTIPSVPLAENGKTYRVVAANVVSNLTYTVTSTNATLKVLADKIPPTLLSAFTLSGTQVALVFSEMIKAGTATLIDNYSLSSGNSTVAVIEARLAADGKTVILTTGPITEGLDYTVQAHGLEDNSMAANKLTDGQISFRALAYVPVDIGAPLKPGSLASAAGGYNVNTYGSQIGGISDQFHFSYQERVGDFDIKVRLQSLSSSNVWAQAGLMARESLAADSRFASVLSTTLAPGSFFSTRPTKGGASAFAGSFPANHPHTWLRLQRIGNSFIAYAGIDGSRWSRLGSTTLALPDKILFGLVAASHGAGEKASVEFRDLMSSGPEVAGPIVLPIEPLAACSRNTGLVISEIMYHPSLSADGLDLEFVELYNSQPFFEDISGYRLSGDIDYTFPGGTLLPAGAFLVIAKAPADVGTAYALPNVLGPYQNQLPNDAGMVRLRNKRGSILLEVNYGSGAPWPKSADGAGHSLVLAKPSYGEQSHAAWAASDRMGGSPGRAESFGQEPLRPIMINEFLAHPAEGNLDYIELYNHSNEPVDLSGSFVSDDPAIYKFQFPPGTILAARGFITRNEAELGFALSTRGEALYLINRNQTQVLDAVGFRGQAAGVPTGRFPDGSPSFHELRSQTPAAPNSPPLLRDIVINELMYHPIGGNSEESYVELYNRGASPINLEGWTLGDAIGFTFPSGAILRPNRYVVIAQNLATLRAKYPRLTAETAIGNYSGTLGGKGERLTLSMPVTLTTTNDNNIVSTSTFPVVVDEVSYKDGGRWGKWSDGGGSSLELIDARSDNRLAPNWAASDESRKATNWTTIEFTGVLDNGSSAYPADSLHIMMLGEGECLIDDIEVTRAGSGLNMVANSTFQGGISGWLFQGNHDKSTLETEAGYNSSRSFHLRASGDGDPGANRVRTALSSTIPASATATLRAKVRWLAGHPEIVLRLHGNWLEAAGALVVPTDPGSPGEANSRLLANRGPAIVEVTHTPAVPAANQPVLVTARVLDPDGLASVQLRYRLDPSATVNTLEMRDDGTGGDSVAGDGLFSATLPGRDTTTLVAYYVEAMDTFTPAGTTRFPDDAPARECLVRFGDTQTPSSFGTYRLWMTAATYTRWSNREKLSNQPMDCTFVNGNQRVIYNVGAYYAGSPYKGSGYTTPNGAVCDYIVRFPKDETFLGVSDFKLVYPGNVNGDDNTAQREQASFWIAGQIGLAINNRRFVNFYVNGVKRGQIIEDAQLPNSDFINAHYPTEATGELFKVSLWYEYANDLSSFTPTPATLQKFTTTGGIKKTARYRWSWLPHAVDSSANNFTSLFALVDALNSSAAVYTGQVESLVDVEQWMRTFAFEHIVGNWDSYGSDNGSNMYAYKPTSGLWRMQTWDVDISFVADGPTSDLFKTGDPTIARMYTHPPFRRAYLRALQDAANGPLVASRIAPLLDAKYAALRADGVSVSPATVVKSYVEARRNQILTQLAAVAASFTVAGPVGFTSVTNVTTLTGTAPIAVKTIVVNDSAYPIVWTSLSGWSLRVPLAPGANPLVLTGYDVRGQPVAGASKTLNVFYSGGQTTPLLSVRINEWLASNSRFADFDGRFQDWFELYNPSGENVDLSGCFLTDDPAQRAKWVVPSGTFISEHGMLLVWADNETLQNQPGGDLHTNFKLGKDGGRIGLYLPDLAQIDLVNYGIQSENVSQGRWPDGGDKLYYMSSPTPRAANGVGNSAPELAPIPGLIVGAGKVVAFTAVASDAQAPPQTLTFSLAPEAPVGATIESATGAFRWRAPVGENITTNIITIQVNDGGSPDLSAQRRFEVVVLPPLQGSEVRVLPDGSLAFSWKSYPGKTYRIEWTETLLVPSWSVLGSNSVALENRTRITVPPSGRSQTYYRIVQVD